MQETDEKVMTGTVQYMVDNWVINKERSICETSSVSAASMENGPFEWEFDRCPVF